MAQGHLTGGPRLSPSLLPRRGIAMGSGGDGTGCEGAAQVRGCCTSTSGSFLHVRGDDGANCLNAELPGSPAGKGDAFPLVQLSPPASRGVSRSRGAEKMSRRQLASRTHAFPSPWSASRRSGSRFGAAGPSGSLLFQPPSCGGLVQPLWSSWWLLESVGQGGGQVAAQFSCVCKTCARVC